MIYGYLRVSTSEQTVDNQSRRILDAGFAIDAWYDDSAVTGSKPAFERIAFKQMTEVLQAGDSIVVTEVSRLGRSVSDVLKVIDWLTKHCVKVRIVNLDGIDITSPMGRLILTVMASCAQFEKDLLIERTNAGLARARASGKVLGKPLKVSPEQLAQAFAWMSEGIKHMDIAFRCGVSEVTLSSLKKQYRTVAGREAYKLKWEAQQVQVAAMRLEKERLAVSRQEMEDSLLSV